jgi:hypothetical protein
MLSNRRKIHAALPIRLPTDAAADAPRNERLRQRLAKGVLRWGGDAEGGAPFHTDPNTKQPSASKSSWSTASLRVASTAQSAGTPSEVRTIQMGRCAGLAKDFDLIVSGLPETAMIFSRPYYVYSQQLNAGRRNGDP